MPMTSSEMLKYLKKNGFIMISQNGSHIKMRNPHTKKAVIVPCHTRDLKQAWNRQFKAGWFKIILLSIQGGILMRKLFYPAIFHTAEEGGFWITFPDLPECMTQGDDMQNAYEMAVDALGLAISSRKNERLEIPTPSNPHEINTSVDEYCVVIEFDMLAYQKRTNSKAVKKTLTIPAWLNEEALSLGINFSQVLQEALLQKIDAKL